MTDPQLPLIPTVRIDPSTLVEHMPGTDAVCLCKVADDVFLETGRTVVNDCLWPFCGWKTHMAATACSCGGCNECDPCEIT